MGSARRAKKKLTGRDFRLAQKFLEIEDADRWKVSDRTDHLMAQVAFYIYMLDLRVGSMFAKTPLKVEKEFKDFLLQIGDTPKIKQIEIWEVVDPNEPDLHPLHKKYIEFRRKYAAMKQPELDRIEREMNEARFRMSLGVKS